MLSSNLEVVYYGRREPTLAVFAKERLIYPLSHSGEVARGAETQAHFCKLPEPVFLLVNHTASHNQDHRVRCLQNFKEWVWHIRVWR